MSNFLRAFVVVAVLFLIGCSKKEVLHPDNTPPSNPPIETPDFEANVKIDNITDSSAVMHLSIGKGKLTDDLNYTISSNDKVIASKLKDTVYLLNNLTDKTDYTIVISFNFKGTVLSSKSYSIKTPKRAITFQTNIYYDDIIGGDDVINTKDGGYLVTAFKLYGGEDAGSNQMSAYEDITIIKLDSLGKDQWHKKYTYRSNPNSEIVKHKLTATADGNYMVNGSNVLLKIDNQGNKLWDTAIKGTNGDYLMIRDYVITKDNKIFACGDYRVNASLIKFNSDGTIVWAKELVPEKSIQGKLYSVAATSEGEIMLWGTTRLTQSNSSYWVLKTDPEGKILWEKAIEDKERREAFPEQIKVTSDGNFVCLGTSYGLVNEVRLLKVSPLGEIVADKAVGTTYQNVRGSTFDFTSDGGLIIVGTDFGFVYNLALIKLDRQWGVQWQKYYREFSYDYYGRGVKQTNDGGYVISGYRETSVFVQKRDISGNFRN